jgi:hypothetical protein
MSGKPEIVQVQMDRPMIQQPTKALHIKIGQNKTVVVYNHANGYIVDALMKAVFNDAH